ncbi:MULTISPECIES: GLPGLI family protein [unclassified Leeuwenhoekiella]|uniref:GLPGLI family protein n=1 Tax=unclassified Leeuwenhoekiella TaxID=2615029 RepID=UPI000C5357E4|nr:MULTISPECIES: GLPGLI family protein [unclassified Leeuwenhoekiella]MBA82531.1 GLPGLI family protein [Leeuwenhoekiella sp.]|tara:strand:- start:15130 stop:15963 length:834 start_codon:yes stop_codon:yes gene_type:complete
MKIYSILLVLTALLIFPAQAQKFDGGIATYQSKTSFDMDNFGGRELSEQMKKQIAERMKSRLEKTFTLSFSKDESIYEEEAKLETPGAGGGMRFMGGGFSQGGIYKNIAADIYARQNELMGKTFLVKDTLAKLDWKLEKESKMIGQYAAFKATAVRKIEQNPWEALRRNRNAQADTTATEAPKEMIITAWYTPQIPVSQGPDEYWGLPGLILEVSAGPTVILCNKIVINPQSGLEIEMPEKGDEVSREEYEKIVAEKTKEMSERMGGGRGGFGRGRG